jgi:hypothetical protein
MGGDGYLWTSEANSRQARFPRPLLAPLQDSDEPANFDQYFGCTLRISALRRCYWLHFLPALEHDGLEVASA